ncbi:MAG: hypothetical protein AB9M60_12185 [Leptothrix sp. (in: b-proteobacteria)]
MPHAQPAAATPLPWVIDVEASGFGTGSYPIEVGFVSPIGAVVCTLIQPEPGWTHWDLAAERVHGVSRETLRAHGKPAAVVAALLNRHLADQPIYCNAWAHDYTWLARLFDAAEVAPRFRLHDLRELLSEAQLARFDAARREVEAGCDLRRHRASTDARVLQLSVGAVVAQTG